MEYKIIQGKQVTIRPATGQNRRIIYKWFAESDITPSIMGLLYFPDHPVPTWEEFCDDYGHISLIVQERMVSGIYFVDFFTSIL